jgi:hypothetical protein
MRNESRLQRFRNLDDSIIHWRMLFDLLIVRLKEHRTPMSLLLCLDPLITREWFSFPLLIQHKLFFLSVLEQKLFLKSLISLMHDWRTVVRIGCLDSFCFEVVVVKPVNKRLLSKLLDKLPLPLLLRRLAALGLRWFNLSKMLDIGLLLSIFVVWTMSEREMSFPSHQSSQNCIVIYWI